ncbi:MAG: hypothetical protein HJJLKODD_00087 [Phycisphaerae bacterium]|nr:hypothetical protein [Phycisphaerae bacterium]
MTQNDSPQKDASKTTPAAPVPESTATVSTGAADGLPLDPRDEKELWKGHTHWHHYMDLHLLALAWTIVAVVLICSVEAPWLKTTFYSLLAAGWLYALGRTFIGMLNHRYRLTSQRLFIETGILSKTIDQTELIRVDDVRITKSLFDRIVALGTVQIISTDSTNRDLRIRGIKRPDEVADLIRQNMRTLRRKSLYVENL